MVQHTPCRGPARVTCRWSTSLFLGPSYWARWSCRYETYYAPLPTAFHCSHTHLSLHANQAAVIFESQTVLDVIKDCVAVSFISTIHYFAFELLARYMTPVELKAEMLLPREVAASNSRRVVIAGLIFAGISIPMAFIVGNMLQ